LEDSEDDGETPLDYIQLVLLNLLLPVLTAILGYVFGSNQANSAEGDSS